MIHGAWISFPPPPFSLLPPPFQNFHILILSNEEKTNDYENFEKGMIYMKIWKKGVVVEKRGEEEAKSMPHAPVLKCKKIKYHIARSVPISNR